MFGKLLLKVWKPTDALSPFQRSLYSHNSDLSSVILTFESQPWHGCHPAGAGTPNVLCVGLTYTASKINYHKTAVSKIFISFT